MAATTLSAATDVADPSPKNRFEEEESVSTRPGDLFWDLLIKVIATGMILLAAYDIFAFLTSAGVRCLTPDSYNPDQSAFINGFCSEHTPVTDYFLFYVVAQALFIVGPHLLWQVWFSGRLSFFVALALTLDRHRDSKTGDYAPKNYVVAEQLLNAFHCKQHMVVFYVLKQIAQLFLILVAVVVSSVVFNDYNTIFPCPGRWDTTTNRTWPLPTKLNCSYSVLRSHQAAWVSNYLLLGLALACTVYGLVWCSFSHGRKLNWKEAARFALESGISHKYYHSRGFFKELLRRQIHFHNHIHSDLDFLLLKLFPQDVGRAYVLRELLIGTFVQRELDGIHQRLNLLRESEKEEVSGSIPNEGLIMKKLIADSTLTVELPESRKTVKEKSYTPRQILGTTMAQFLVYIATAEEFGVQATHPTDQPDVPQQCWKIQGTSINISFGSVGYAHFLTQFCERVLFLNFHPHLVDHKDPVHYRGFHSDIHHLTVLGNIYALPVNYFNKLDEVLSSHSILLQKEDFDTTEVPVKLIVVSPFTNPDRIVTIKWFLHRCNRNCTSDTRLIAFTPVRIGHADVKFKEFEPPSEWKPCAVDFKYVKQAAETGTGMNYCVMPEDSQGSRVVLQCGGVQCAFEVKVYQHVSQQT